MIFILRETRTTVREWACWTFGKKEILQTITDFVFVKESPRHREQVNPQLMELGKTPIKVDNMSHYLMMHFFT
jgi:hypothetical protein